MPWHEAPSGNPEEAKRHPNQHKNNTPQTTPAAGSPSESRDAYQDWWGPTSTHSQAAAEWGQQQTSNTETSQPATAAAEPSWEWGAQSWTGHHTTASDTQWSQSWQPAEWQYDGDGTHQAGAATQPHATHHASSSEAPHTDSRQAQWQSNTGTHHPQPAWNTTETQPAAAVISQQGGASDPLWDGRTLRLSARPRRDNNPGPPPWVHQVRDGRQGGSTPQQAPAPSPPPLQQQEHTDLMQRHSSITAAQQALQAANRRGETQAMAMQQQVQLIHDIAEHVGGEPGAAVMTLCDVLARHIALLAPTGALPETCKTSRKRALTEPNVLVEAPEALSLMSRFSFSGGASLTSE